MTDQTVTGTDAGDAAEFEAARSAALSAEQAPSQPANDTPPAEQQRAPAEQQQPPQDDLPLDEIRKRWQDQKGATAQERALRRQAEQERDQDRRRLAEISQQLERLTPQQRQDAGSQMPDATEDPIGALQWLMERQAEGQQTEAQRREQEQQERQRVDQEQRIVATLQDHEAEFRETAPDYDDATKFLYESRAREYALLGYNEQQVANIMQGEVLNISAQALRSGKSPAQVFYDLAKGRGFGGQQAVERLKQVAAGQDASRTLSGTGGTPNDGLSAGAIANLDGAAFDAAFEKLAGTAKKQERGF